MPVQIPQTGAGRGRGRGMIGRGRADGSPLSIDRLREERTAAEASSNKLYEKAVAVIEAQSKKYLETHQMDEDWTSSEDEEESSKATSIVDSIFKDYEMEDMKESVTQEYLSDALKTGAATCLICLSSLRRNDPIWNCLKCFASHHITCIQKWAKDCSSRRVSTWACPKCRHDYTDNEVPRVYKCFCGKVENPPNDPWLMPHSCGNKCNKALKPECGHVCLLLCHPGPCPTCPQTVQNKCYCGKNGPIPRRCGFKEWSCGKPCSKVLGCGSHRCTDPCHIGACPPCPKTSIQACQCGRSKMSRPCDVPQWQCQEICGKAFSCGNHTCKVVCHKGACGDCPRQGPRACPCGKSTKTVPCSEDVLPCGDTCGKPLMCKLHNCEQRCHKGACEDCLMVGEKQCRCGARKKVLPCSKEFICDTKCKKIRDCGTHPCSRKCCEGDCPNCEQLCGTRLGCKNHRCESRCHTGPCYPCPLMSSVKCFCGNTSVSVPCGRERNITPPKCKLPCKTPPDCNHTKRDFHRCHFGRCPPCKQICDKALTCGHRCPDKCHVSVFKKVGTNKQKEGPWDVNTAEYKLTSLRCAPCKVPVPVMCFGEHEEFMVACSEAAALSCGRRCGRPLSCGKHVCEKECHTVKSNCGYCERKCECPRQCAHPCPRPCHQGDCPPCTQRLKLPCHCGHTTLYVKCGEWLTTNEDKKMSMQSCENQCSKQMVCGHKCPGECHAGACNSLECRKRVTVKCACKRIKKDAPCGSASRLACAQGCKGFEAVRNRKEERKEEPKPKIEGDKPKKKKQKPKNQFDTMIIFTIMSIVMVVVTLLITFNLE